MMVSAEITKTLDNGKMLHEKNQQPGVRGVEFYYEDGLQFYDLRTSTTKQKTP